MSAAIFRCTHCGRDVVTVLGRCQNCGSEGVVDRTKPHDPHWSRYTMNTIICKVCDRVVDCRREVSAGPCHPEQTHSRGQCPKCGQLFCTVHLALPERLQLVNAVPEPGWSRRQVQSVSGNRPGPVPGSARHYPMKRRNLHDEER